MSLPSTQTLDPSCSLPAAGFSGRTGFVERRTSTADDTAAERRQFGSSHRGLSADGRELALAIDRYKLEHHRRYLTCDEMLAVLEGLGYHRDESIES